MGFLWEALGLLMGYYCGIAMGLLQYSCETIVILSSYCSGVAVGFLLDCCVIDAALLTHSEARLTDNY